MGRRDTRSQGAQRSTRRTGRQARQDARRRGTSEPGERLSRNQDTRTANGLILKVRIRKKRQRVGTRTTEPMSKATVRKPQPESTLEWARRETLRRAVEEQGDGPVELKPVKSFPHGQAIFNNELRGLQPREAGEPSRPLNIMVSSYCCGWPEPPTALEVESAIKSRDPTRRKAAIALMVLTEPPNYLVMEGEADGAYSLQDLAWWLHRRQIPAYGRIRWLNAFAQQTGGTEGERARA